MEHLLGPAGNNPVYDSDGDGLTDRQEERLNSDPYAPGQQRYANQYEPRVPDNYTPGRTYEPSGRPPPYQRPRCH